MTISSESKDLSTDLRVAHSIRNVRRRASACTNIPTTQRGVTTAKILRTVNHSTNKKAPLMLEHERGKEYDSML